MGLCHLSERHGAVQNMTSEISLKNRGIYVLFILFIVGSLSKDAQYTKALFQGLYMVVTQN